MLLLTLVESRDFLLVFAEKFHCVDSLLFFLASLVELGHLLGLLTRGRFLGLVDFDSDRVFEVRSVVSGLANVIFDFAFNIFQITWKLLLSGFLIVVERFFG